MHVGAAAHVGARADGKAVEPANQPARQAGGGRVLCLVSKHACWRRRWAPHQKTAALLQLPAAAAAASCQLPRLQAAAAACAGAGACHAPVALVLEAIRRHQQALAEVQQLQAGVQQQRSAGGRCAGQSSSGSGNCTGGAGAAGSCAASAVLLALLPEGRGSGRCSARVCGAAAGSPVVCAERLPEVTHVPQPRCVACSRQQAQWQWHSSVCDACACLRHNAALLLLLLSLLSVLRLGAVAGAARAWCKLRVQRGLQLSHHGGRHACQLARHVSNAAVPKAVHKHLHCAAQRAMMTAARVSGCAEPRQRGPMPARAATCAAHLCHIASPDRFVRRVQEPGRQVVARVHAARQRLGGGDEASKRGLRGWRAVLCAALSSGRAGRLHAAGRATHAHARACALAGVKPGGSQGLGMALSRAKVGRNQAR